MRFMFILRSAFWLTLAFIVLSPKSVDLGAAAGDLSSQAMAAGQQLIRSQILENGCNSIECLGGKAIVAAALKPSLPAAATIEESSADPVPVPRPRPDWLG